MRVFSVDGLTRGQTLENREPGPYSMAWSRPMRMVACGNKTGRLSWRNRPATVSVSPVSSHFSGAYPNRRDSGSLSPPLSFVAQLTPNPVPLSSQSSGLRSGPPWLLEQERLVDMWLQGKARILRQSHRQAVFMVWGLSR